MFILLAFSLLASALPSGTGPGNSPPIRTTAELRAFRDNGKPMRRKLDLTGRILSAEVSTVIVEDAVGRAQIVDENKRCRPGDVVRIQGETLVNARHMPWDEPESITVIGQAELPAPFAVRIDQLDVRRDDLRSVVIAGTVVSSHVDEIDARYHVLILKDGRSVLPVYVPLGAFPDSSPPDIGARIRVTGTFFRRINSYRFFQRPAVISKRIEVLTPTTDPFDVPELKGSAWLTIDEIEELGRRKIVGRVLATWGGDRLMLKADLDNVCFAKICFARLRGGIGLPEVGSSVMLVGETDADFFNLSFEKAMWQTAEPVADDETETPKDVKPRDILLEGAEQCPRFDMTLQGALVRLSGTLLSCGYDRERLILNCEGLSVPVDISTLPENAIYPVVGAELRITGRCLLETSKVTTYDIFPQIRGFMVIARSPADIEVLSLPSWWTSGRLLIAIAALVAVLVAVLVGFAIWNRILNRLVQRRSRELAKAEIAKVSSELRVAERTRLAVELHDSLSQNLTGIALAIGAGEYAMAERSLKSCRRELKNCLWDLRSDALETSDMNEAIRRTLAPNLKDTKLSVRFRLARNAFSDNTAYAILRIVRELAVNAKRHGNATEIRVAGSVEEQRILFSVRDNGRGFDPESAPGIGDGHFGLQGIRERIRHLNGEMKIESSPTTGTRVLIWLKKPQC